jgi:hypothetical protein
MTDALAIATMDKDQITAIKQHCMRIAKSGLVPAHFAGNPEAIYTAIDMARVLGEEPVTFMQHVFFIGGKAGMSAAYMLSRMRRRGVIEGTVEYEEEGKGPELRMRARVVDAVTKRVIAGPWVSMAMAKAEGWTKNAKYSSMPDVMLRSRSITFLVRGHYPDVLMGFLTTEELEDTRPIRATVMGSAGATIGLLSDETPEQHAAKIEKLAEEEEEEWAQQVRESAAATARTREPGEEG